MIDPAVKTDIINALENLPPTQQRQVVAYAYSLNSVSPAGTPWSTVKKHFGVLSQQDADELLKAVESDCETIDKDGW